VACCWENWVAVSLLLGKSTAAIASGENPTNLSAYAGAAITQAGIAGYGAYAVGRGGDIWSEAALGGS